MASDFNQRRGVTFLQSSQRTRVVDSVQILESSDLPALSFYVRNSLIYTVKHCQTVNHVLVHDQFKE